MAHLLRGKQVGIQNDLSEGLSHQEFALDDVRILQLYRFYDTDAFFTLVWPVWSEFPGQRHRIRSRTVAPGRGNQRDTVRKWANLRVRAAKGLRNVHFHAEYIGQVFGILRIEAGLCRFEA